MKTRRDMLKSAALMPMLLLASTSCSKPPQIKDATFEDTVKILLDDLFPKTDTLPSSSQLNILDYINRVLHSKFTSDDDKLFLKNGATWLNESAVERFDRSFHLLDSKQRGLVIEAILLKRWGESFIISLSSYYFEALLGEPIYGSNIDMVGWKWLNHIGGKPQPTKALF